MRLSASVWVGAVLVFALGMTVVHELVREDVARQTGRQMQSAVTRAAADIDMRISSRLRALDAVAEQVRAEDLARDPERLLASRYALASMFDVLVLADASGQVIADYPMRPERRKLNIADREYFTRARDSQGAIVAEPYTGRVILRPLVPFAVALRDEQGRFIGMIMGALELMGGRFLRDIGSAGVGDSGRFMVVSRSAQLLMHPTRPLGVLPDRHEDQWLHRAAEGWTGWTRINDKDGRPGPVVAAQALGQVPWVVLAHLPAAEADAAVTRLDRIFVLVGAAGTLLLALLTWVVTSGNLGTLARLRRQVESIDAGTRSARVDVAGPVEVQGLARAFNGLLDSQRRMQDALAARESFHRTLSDGSPLAMMLFDRDGNCIYANASALALTGRGFEAIAGRGWRACVYGDDADALRGAWRRANQRRAPFEMTVRLLRPDLSVAWAQLRSTPVDEGGQTQYLAALVDITAERAARDTAQREHRRAQAILNTIQDALFVVDGQGMIGELTPAAEQLCGWSRSQAVGAPVARVLRLVDDDGQPVSFDAYSGDEHFDCERWSADTAEKGRRAVDVVWRRFEGGGGGVLTLRDAHERRRAAEEASFAASHDALTALPNRRAFDHALARAHGAFREQAENTVLLMLDLDGFKAVNDGGGHDAGDELLVAVARALRSQVRASDLAARVGGDEFAVLLPGCSEQRAAAIAESIRDAIGRQRVLRAGRAFSVGASIGLSSFTADDESADCLLRRADAAAYAAKRAGRDRVRVAQQPAGGGDCEGCENEPACSAIKLAMRGGG